MWQSDMENKSGSMVSQRYVAPSGAAIELCKGSWRAFDPTGAGKGHHRTREEAEADALAEPINREWVRRTSQIVVIATFGVFLRERAEQLVRLRERAERNDTTSYFKDVFVRFEYAAVRLEKETFEKRFPGGAGDFRLIERNNEALQPVFFLSKEGAEAHAALNFPDYYIQFESYPIGAEKPKKYIPAE